MNRSPIPLRHRRLLPAPSGLLLAAALLATAAPAAGQLALVRQGQESRASMEPGDGFGYALASGDFDGDGYMDVAAGAPFERIGANVEESGAVVISFGGPWGVAWERSELLLATDQFFVPEDDTAWFGYALAAGDANGDGLDDLFVGAPLLDWQGVVDQGAVYQYLGGAGTGGSLQGQVPLVFDQTLFAALAETGDRFGAALWAGYLDGDGFADLLIGGPGENMGSGAVYGGYGSASALLPDASLTLAGFQVGADGDPNDGFGTSVLIADVVRGPEPDLVIGAPFEDLTDGLTDTGAVYIVPMSASGPTAGSTLALTANEWGLAQQQGARFGHALAAGDFRLDGDASLDLAIGAPGDNSAEGQVYLLDGDPMTPLGVDVIDQFRSNDNDGTFTDGENPETGDEFGFALVACDHDGDGMDDLAVGSPGESIRDLENNLRTDVGLVTVLYGDAIGLGWSTRDDNYSEADLNTRSFGGSRTGEALAAGDVDSMPGDSVLVGAASWNVARGQWYDIAPWRQVYGMIANSAVGAGCEEDVYYALRPFDRERTASTGKIMTTLVACEAAQLPANDPDRVPLSTQYTIPAWLNDAFQVTGCSNAGYVTGEVLTFETLLRQTMMISANDGTFAVADLVADDIVAWSGSATTAPQFVALMNAKAAELQMVDTTFENPSGVDTMNQWSTAYDMWLLSRAAMENPLFQDFSGTLSYDYDRLIPDGTELLPLQTTITYGWLVGVQALVPQAIGGKPGDTSVRARVAVARQTDSPWGLAFGLTYGSPTQIQGASSSSRVSKDNAAVLQLALALCDPTITVGDFPPAPGVTGPLTVDGVDLPTLDSVLCADFELTSYGIGEDDVPTQTAYLINFTPVQVNSYSMGTYSECDSVFEFVPGEVYSGGTQEFQRHDGITFGNPDETSTLSLNIAIDQPTPMTFDAVLQPLESFTIPPAMIAEVESLKWEVEILDSRPRLVQVEESYSWIDKVDADQPQVRKLLDQPASAVRRTVTICVGYSEDFVSAFEEVAITQLDPSTSFTWDPCAADRAPYGAGWPGELGVPVLTADADPLLGTTFGVQLGNSRSTTAVGLVLTGAAPLNLPTNRGGNLLVLFDTVLGYSIPPEGLDLSVSFPLDTALCGSELFGQLLVLDPVASKGVAFSRGLVLERGISPRP